MPAVVTSAGPERLDDVKPLWLAMVEHHHAVVGPGWPGREPEEAWRLRRRQYSRWLEGGEAWLFLAEVPDSSEPVGYAVLRRTEPGPTWNLGESIGVLESLSVVPDRRGEGTGSALLGACRRTLVDAGIAYWTVTVVEANAAAARLYERAGFLPFYRDLVGRVDDLGTG